MYLYNKGVSYNLLLISQDGDSGDDSGSSTSDSDASVAGRDEVIRDADDYATTTTIIRCVQCDVIIIYLHVVKCGCSYIGSLFYSYMQLNGILQLEIELVSAHSYTQLGSYDINL